MKVAIIGAGWVGCHLAVKLLEIGCDVTVFERFDRVFAGASGANQCRLHLGFHYPRSHATRLQVIQTYQRMISTYGNFVEPVANNVYAIATATSLIDFWSYKAIMASEGVQFRDFDPDRLGLTNVEGAVVCDEQALNLEECRRSFERRLRGRIRFSVPVRKMTQSLASVQIEGQAFDLAVDCTYNNMMSLRTPPYTYEPCVMFRYQYSGASDFALTVMDGLFGSIYPYPNENPAARDYLLSAVEHTPLDEFDRYEDALELLSRTSNAELMRLAPKFEDVIHTFFPRFRDDFTLSGLVAAVKTKPAGLTEGRECEVRIDGRIAHAYCGKISHLFLAEDAVMTWLAREGFEHPDLATAIARDKLSELG